MYLEVQYFWIQQGLSSSVSSY